MYLLVLSDVWVVSGFGAYMPVFLLGIYPGVELLGRRSTYSQRPWIMPISYSTSSKWDFLLRHILWSIGSVVHNYGFNLPFLDDICSWAPSICWWTNWQSSLGNDLLSCLEHLKHKVLFLTAFWQGYFVCLYFKIVWILYHLCGLSGKVSTYQCRRCEFDPWVGKIPWRRKWPPTPVFLSGKSHRQRSLVGYSPRDLKSWMCLNDWARGWAWFQIHTLEKLLELIYEFSKVAGFKSNTQIHTFVGSVCCSVALWMFLFIPSFLRALILIIQPVVLWIWLFHLA